MAIPNTSPIPTFSTLKELYSNALIGGGLVNCPFCERVKYQLRVTPSANRNSYRVAMIGGVDTQGSVLRPQPWAGESQLLQSCCCLWIFIYCGWCAPTGYAWLAHCGWSAHASCMVCPLWMFCTHGSCMVSPLWIVRTLGNSVGVAFS